MHSRRAHAVLGDEPHDRRHEGQQQRPAPPGARVPGSADDKDGDRKRRRECGNDEEHAPPAADEGDPHDRQNEQRGVARLGSALRLTEKRDERVAQKREEEQRVRGQTPRQSERGGDESCGGEDRQTEEEPMGVGRAKPRRRECDAGETERGAAGGDDRGVRDFPLHDPHIGASATNHEAR